MPRLGPFTIDRPRLRERLDERAPLTLLRAPAGFGKTTLAAQWAATTSEVVAWWRVPRGSRDAYRFWADALQALSDAGLPTPSIPWAAIPAPDSSDLTLAIERTLLEAGVPVVVVVDGFEQISEAGADRVLLDILRHTANLHLVATLRGQRHFGARHHLDLGTVELTARDLRFTTEETGRLLASAGVPMPRSHMAAVWEATGGWPEPTRSLALRLRQRQTLDDGDVQSTLDSVAAGFLRERLLTDDEPARIDFVLRTSVVDEFTDEIAELVADDPAAERHMEALEAQGFLLIAEHDGQQTYRWPRAARVALRAELECRDAELASELHRRLSRWHHDRGDLEPALRHAVASRDWELAIEVIEASWRGLLIDNNDVLLEAFVAIPMEYVERSPRALALRDAKLRVPDDRLLAAIALPPAPDALAEIGRRDEADQALDTCLAVLIALRTRGELALAREYGLRALQIARSARSAHPARVRDLYATLHLQVGISQLLVGDIGGAVLTMREGYHKGAEHALGYLQSDAAAKLALAHCLLGDSGQVETWMSLHRQASLTPAPLGRHAWLLPAIRHTAAAAELLLSVDRLDLTQAARADSTLSRSVRDEELWALLLYARAQYALHNGTAEEMLRTLEMAGSSHQSSTGRDSLAGPLLAAAEADLHLSLGRGNLAQAALSRGDGTHASLRVGQARLALLTRRTPQALQLTYDADWERVAARQDLLAMQLIRAVAAQRVGDIDLATATIERVTRAAAAAQTWRPFLTVPQPEIDELLQRSAAARQLLAHTPLGEAPGLFPERVTVIELTERERQVLVDLARGLSLAQIAKASVLSDNTVRTQRRSLYRKLGAGDRGEAIARAREWGLLRTEG